MWGDGSVRTAGVWRKIRQHEGLRQGGPLSCLLAGVAMARQMRRARNVIDWQNGVLPCPADSSPEVVVMRAQQAAKLGSFMAYLDDGALCSRMRALVFGGAEYIIEGHRGNWEFVSYKSLLGGGVPTSCGVILLGWCERASASMTVGSKRRWRCPLGRRRCPIAVTYYTTTVLQYYSSDLEKQIGRATELLLNS